MDDGVEDLLLAWREGSLGARDELVAKLHPTLAEIAAARLRRDYKSSLSTGDLINEAVLKLVRREALTIKDRAHVIALASHLMRNILIDHARAKSSAKRQHERVELCTKIDGGHRFDLHRLEIALTRLRALDVDLMELVEMRYFGGMTTTEIATVLGISERTVKRRWQVARGWLMDALDGSLADD